MAISVKHPFTSPKADGTDSTLVQPSNWNAEHTITLAAGKVLGRDTSAAGAMQELPLAFDSSGNATVSATGSFTPPVGTTGQRPATPATGMMRYNTSTTAFEGYNGSAWGNLTPASAAVASISFGSTGLTPNTATTGAVSVAGTLAVANGGTGLASAGALGNVLTSNGTTWSSTTPVSTGITSGTAVSASGTAVDFTSLPSTVKRITVMLSGLSTNGSSDYWVQLGTAASFASSGYVGYCARQGLSQNAYTAFSFSYVIASSITSSYLFSGNIYITNITGNTWTITGQITDSSGTASFMNSAGYVPLSAILTRIRITSATPDTFDSGTINIFYE